MLSVLVFSRSQVCCSPLLFNFNSLLFTGFNFWLLLFFTVLFLYFGAHWCFVDLHYALTFCGPTFWLLLCGAHFKFKVPAQLFKSWIAETEESRSEIAELLLFKTISVLHFKLLLCAACCCMICTTKPVCSVQVKMHICTGKSHCYALLH